MIRYHMANIGLVRVNGVPLTLEQLAIKLCQNVSSTALQIFIELCLYQRLQVLGRFNIKWTSVIWSMSNCPGLDYYQFRFFHIVEWSISEKLRLSRLVNQCLVTAIVNDGMVEVQISPTSLFPYCRRLFFNRGEIRHFNIHVDAVNYCCGQSHIFVIPAIETLSSLLTNFQ